MDKQQIVQHISNLSALVSDKHDDLTKELCHATGTLLKGEQDLYVRLGKRQIKQCAAKARYNAALLLQLADIIDNLSEDIH